MPKYEEPARVVAEAIRELASKPENLDNLEAYLAYNFGAWLEKWASTPEWLAAELREFAAMDI